MKKQVESYIYDRLKNHFESCRSLISILFEDISDLEAYNKAQLDTLTNRLISGEPIQYVTGVAPFYGHLFYVNSDVLIPRPETEELVYAIEKHVKKKGLEKCRILDIGTGSGCIPISLARLFPGAEVFGLDTSEQALEVANINNKKLDSNVTFMVLDILDPAHWDKIMDFDILVSNPPYIPHKEKGMMASNVLDHEPHLALFVENDDPLIFYKTIYEFARSKSKNATIFLECNEFNTSEVAQIYELDYNIELIKDLQQKDRIIKATKSL